MITTAYFCFVQYICFYNRSDVGDNPIIACFLLRYMCIWTDIFLFSCFTVNINSRTFEVDESITWSRFFQFECIIDTRSMVEHFQTQSSCSDLFCQRLELAWAERNNFSSLNIIGNRVFVKFVWHIFIKWLLQSQN